MPVKMVVDVEEAITFIREAVKEINALCDSVNSDYCYIERELKNAEAFFPAQIRVDEMLTLMWGKSDGEWCICVLDGGTYKPLRQSSRRTRLYAHKYVHLLVDAILHECKCVLELCEG